jgi:hypothetical protein
MSGGGIPYEDDKAAWAAEQPDLLREGWIDRLDRGLWLSHRTDLPWPISHNFMNQNEYPPHRPKFVGM